jgi:hypothetical protein
VHDWQVALLSPEFSQVEQFAGQGLHIPELFSHYEGVKLLQLPLTHVLVFKSPTIPSGHDDKHYPVVSILVFTNNNTGSRYCPQHAVQSEVVPPVHSLQVAAHVAHILLPESLVDA